MKFTLNDCIARINQVLNYPAVAYEDISHFFDQAIAELNTNLRIALPSVSEMLSEHTFEVTEQEGLVRLTTEPNAETEIPYYPTLDALKTANPAETKYAYVRDSILNPATFYKWNGTDWDSVPTLYGIYVGANGMKTYGVVPIAIDDAVWVPVDTKHVTSFDLEDYLPLDWWVLFVIPYVCFKFAVRNGDSGELFVDEYTQGYQQLQSSYNVPNTVKLAVVAGKPAYTELVKKHINDLAITVFTRAIYEDMRVGNGIMPTYNGFYETGGWV